MMGQSIDLTQNGGAGNWWVWTSLLSATSAHTCTGDGSGMVARQDFHFKIWFVQFHPTGLWSRVLDN